MVCLEGDVIVVLPMGFGNSVHYIYSESQTLQKKMHRSSSTDSKTFVLVISPLEYIRKQQVLNPKRAE